MVTRRGGAHPAPAEPIDEPMPIRRNLNMRTKCPYGCNKILAQRTIDYHRTNGVSLPFFLQHYLFNFSVVWAKRSHSLIQVARRIIVVASVGPSLSQGLPS